MFDWNDLRYFLAVAHCGSTIAAARSLDVNQSTVQRRIAELEQELGHALVRRHPSGYSLTEFGETLLPAAQAVEQATDGVQRASLAYASALQGTIKLTCPEPLVARITSSGLFDAFHARYPQLRVELVMSDRYLDIAKGEADVALRSGEPDDESLVGRRIGDSVWAVYASQGFVQIHGKPASIADIANFPIVEFSGALANHRAAKWFAAIAPSAVAAASNNSVLGVLHAVKSGIGLAPLPTTIAASHGDLVQVLPPVDELNRGWYLLTHPDLRHTPRIRALFDYIVDHLDIVRPILMG